MSNTAVSTNLYPHPFSKGYWRDAAQEFSSVKMLVLTALLVALRIALKPLAIPLGPQLSIQTAMLATALGAMIYGPVISIPAAIISDTLGFVLWPTGDYFLPFVLTEIASTVIYALFLYRSKVTPVRVMLARFCICFFVNVILQQGIIAWQYSYLGNPEEAKETIMGIFGTARVFKNLAFFPIESVVLTLFLKVLLPVTQRMRITHTPDSDLRFTKKVIIWLVCLTVAGAGIGTAYLGYHYSEKSRTLDYSTEDRVEANKSMSALIYDRTDTWDDETVVCVVDSAFRGLFQKETDYTVSVYILDEDAFRAGQAKDKTYSLETLWKYSKSGPKNDSYGSLVKVATLTVTKNESTGELSNWVLAEVQ